VIALLDADPDLARGLDPERFAQARRECLCRQVEVPEGPWPDELSRLQPGDLGLLVLEGRALRLGEVGSHRGAEVLGPGDLLRPADFAEPADVVPVVWRLSALTELRVAVLDRAAASRLARHPELVAGLLERALGRARHLVTSLAAAQAPRVDRRIMLLLWRLAERFGRVTPGGTLVELPLTHEMLSWLVAARRPAVSSALTRLQRAGALQRPRPDAWLLGGTPDRWLGPERHDHAVLAS
jgi:CRP-like cAMP-binding protein